MKGPQVVKGVAALALVALAAAVGASAAPPPTSVTCSVGGKTSFAHPPRGTGSVTFVYGALADVVTWVSGQRAFATPTDVTGNTVVVATFYDGGAELASVQSTCS